MPRHGNKSPVCIYIHSLFRAHYCDVWVTPSTPSTLQRDGQVGSINMKQKVNHLILAAFLFFLSSFSLLIPKVVQHTHDTTITSETLSQGCEYNPEMQKVKSR